ncbi:magnesium/cobalt transporter CorA [Agitococcus lubricus]|uniref:Magnesium transport protein CorA n=1 Tax=Agitococcus lubricus TaxID=1077255 RepID=A0A2T5IZ59_9GAMM|nr:magnesium/cobalt transporter CorA [Agitococcus lubricus]PTQ89323.1 magnesium transporter [Agitococcus lubricus]
MIGVVNCVAYSRKTGQKIADIPLADVSETLAADADAYVWVGLYQPNALLLQEVQSEFGLHDLAVEDALRQHQRPKAEAYGDSVFIVVRTARLESDDICFGETHIFAGARYVITVRQGASLSYAPVRQHCEQNPKQMRYGTGYILYALLDFVVDNYFPVTEDLGTHLQALEREIFADTFKRQTIRHLYDLKADLVRLRMAVTPLQDICNFLMHHTDVALVPRGILPYFRDIHDHSLRIHDAIDAQSEMLRVAMDVNLALVSVGQNEIVKRLASWAAILAIPTMIASFYGMNFDNMPELHWRLGYPFAMLTMFVGCLWLYRRLKRAKWL